MTKTKDEEPNEIAALKQRITSLEQLNKNLEILIDDSKEATVKLQYALMDSLAELVESRDSLTGRHIERTRQEMAILLKRMMAENIYTDESARWDPEMLVHSSSLHDVGKIAIKDGILLKQGRLSPEEMTEMRKHTTYGVQIIDKLQKHTGESDFLGHARLFAASHHDHWDGSGYPSGLAGYGIPLEGRLMAIVDVYDALTNERPYKKASSHEQAVHEIDRAEGSQFDPALVRIFDECAGDFSKVSTEA
jgi:putative two-component system response regulator